MNNLLNECPPKFLTSVQICIKINIRNYSNKLKSSKIGKSVKYVNLNFIFEI